MTKPAIEWGVAALTLPGQVESGDRHVVAPFPRGVLIAAVDGLGHGDEAAAAARTAASVLEAHPEEPVIALVQRCHRQLRDTRGVALSLASLDISHGLLNWVGVGNVQGVLWRSGPGANATPDTLLLRGGVVGGQLPQLQAAVLPVLPGDTLILATDGIRNDFAEGPRPSGAPQKTAEAILAHSTKGHDDALVLVVRFVRNEEWPRQ